MSWVVWIDYGCCFPSDEILFCSLGRNFGTLEDRPLSKIQKDYSRVGSACLSKNKSVEEMLVVSLRQGDKGSVLSSFAGVDRRFSGYCVLVCTSWMDGSGQEMFSPVFFGDSGFPKWSKLKYSSSGAVRSTIGGFPAGGRNSSESFAMSVSSEKNSSSSGLSSSVSPFFVYSGFPPISSGVSAVRISTESNKIPANRLASQTRL